MQVLSYDEAAARAGIVRRTLERLISFGEGPAIVEISSRRRGIMETDLERWLNARRRLPPGIRRVNRIRRAGSKCQLREGAQCLICSTPTYSLSNAVHCA